MAARGAVALAAGTSGGIGSFAGADEPIGRSGVFAAFARLSGDDRDVLGLRIVAGFTSEQAAVGLGLPPSAVEARLTSALRRLAATAPGITPEQTLAALRTLA